MDDPSQVLARNLSLLEKRERTRPRSPTPQGDRTLQTLVADLVAARTAAGLTQEDVAARMWTTKSAISRLESAIGTRPTLRTIERYACAVAATVEIRVRTRIGR